jgi:GNAT superfamily N-acetyltransferase
MHIQNLSTTDLEDIVFSILVSFDGYFVTMPSETRYWADKFKRARVDFSLSFGMFDKDVLIGFIINGIDTFNGELTAFNAGTGVVPKFRKKGIVAKLYAYAFPVFKEQGINRCALEVIQSNAVAIRVYERIGFSTQKSYSCFKGKLSRSKEEVRLEIKKFSSIKNNHQGYYSWDNCDAGINKSEESTYQIFEVFDSKNQKIGFFVINSKSGYLPQFEIIETSNFQHWQLLFDGIAQIRQDIKINNIDTKRKNVIDALLALGLEKYIEQFEMQLTIF